MRDKGCIVSYKDGIASVIPLLSDTCINCNSPTCAKRGTPFLATNPHNLDLHPGDVVKIEAPASIQLAQGIFSLLLPILGAVAGFFLAAPLATALGREPTEAMRAGGVLLMLILTTLIIFILSKTLLKLTKPQVTAIIHDYHPKIEGCLL